MDKYVITACCTFKFVREYILFFRRESFVETFATRDAVHRGTLHRGRSNGNFVIHYSGTVV